MSEVLSVLCIATKEADPIGGVGFRVSWVVLTSFLQAATLIHKRFAHIQHSLRFDHAVNMHVATAFGNLSHQLINGVLDI